MAKEETVTLTRADLETMLRQSAEAAASATVAAMREIAPRPVGPTADILADIDKAERERKPQTIKLFPHLSRTGAAMHLRVVESRSFPHGRIVGLEDYTYPKGWNVHVDAGGLSKTPVTVSRPNDPNVRFNPLFNQKVTWEQYWRTDINALVGQPFHPTLANMTEEDFAAFVAKSAE